MPGPGPGIHPASQKALLEADGSSPARTDKNAALPAPCPCPIPRRATRHCRIVSHIVRGVRTVAPPPYRGSSAGPVAQWLEPAAHNGLVAGSSPAGPTISFSRRRPIVSAKVRQRLLYPYK
jgi:hypothetical protein